MNWPNKEEWGAKLLEWPLLRQLLYERWFRLGFAAFLLIFIFLALFLPKIWRTSRTDFLPVVKVSGLDLVQAWSLKRTALRAAAIGDFDQAAYAWQAALANNQADPELVRGALQSILQDPHRQQHASQGIRQALWLLRLTGTNLVDLELAAKVLEEYRQFDFILELVKPRINQITPGLAAVYLKALFDQGRVQAFDTRWNELSHLLENNPELALYRSAYLVGWGPPGAITAARQHLDAAIKDPALRSQAYRLKLAVSMHEMDSGVYGQTLKRLEESREDTLNQHIGYWRLLAVNGHKAEAVQLAQDYPHPPVSAGEVVELAQIYSELDLRDSALQILQRYAKEFGYAPVYWVTYANILVQTKRWEELRNLALQMRSEEGVRDPLSGFSYFVEGRAELALGREANALMAFRKVSEREFVYPYLGQEVAAQLFQLGQAELARQVLISLEKPLGDQAAYWVLLFAVADRLKEVDLLVKAATRAYQLNPHDSMVINNYAAALIISRQNPQDVIRVTLQLFSQNPNSLYALVNHSAALLLNERPKEAEALLNRVRTNTLTRGQLALYNLDLFETYFNLHQYDLAWTMSDRIESEQLYPTQRRWLEQVRRELPPRQKPG